MKIQAKALRRAAQTTDVWQRTERWAFRLAGVLTLAFAWGAAPLFAGQSGTGAAPPEPAPPPATQSVPEAPTPQADSSMHGKVVDQTGVGVSGAKVKLIRGTQPGALADYRETLTDSDGNFAFAHVPSGAFRLAVTAAGFSAQEVSGSAAPGENFAVPQVRMTVASLVTEVRVTPPSFEIAEEQIKEEEKQRALGFIPNYYVTYLPDAAPLAPRQKFELAWKSMIDPVTFAITGAVAGLQQAQNDFSGYGQGADGYAQRYGAAYADAAIGTFIGGAILPSVLHQDPRYFYKGTGSKKSRLLYALANAVICKGDNGKWQANYSGLLGGLAAGGISNLYYPSKDRDVGLTFQNFAIGIGATAAANVLQEFVVKRLTPSAAHDPGNGTESKPHNAVSRAICMFGCMTRDGD